MLGVGNMSGAILAGLRGSPIAPQAPIRVTNRTGASARAIPPGPGVRALALEDEPRANEIALAGARIVVLGVKPGMIADLLRSVAAAIEPGAVVISVAAGVTIASIERLLSAGQPVVRAMPNTPAAIGLGVTGIARGTAASDEDAALARAIFAQLGEVVEVSEERIDAVAGISGSGPAYVYLFMEELIRVAEASGLPAADARRMVEMTVLGAAEMSRRHPEHSPAELRRRVTSPGGTTERAIAVFQERELGGIVRDAVTANIRRSAELAAQDD